MTNATQRANQYGVAPSGQTVDMLMDRLASDPDFVIDVMVNNRFDAVSKRYTEATGLVATSPIALAKELKLMRNRGGLDRKKALYCIAVPYEARGNQALDVAVQALRSEFLALRTDPSFSGANKSNRELFDEEQVEWWTPEQPAGTSDIGRSNEFWNSLPGILTGLGGLVGAFTGNVPSAAGPAVPTPQPQPSTNWMQVVLIGLAVAAGITGIALIIRAYKKK